MIAIADVLEQALAQAWLLGAKLETDPPRLRLLVRAEKQLMLKRSHREEDRDVTDLVSKELVRRRESDAILTRNVLIFKTSKQRTWISFTTVGVLCSLDNRLKGEKFSVQWFQSFSVVDHESIRATDRPNKSGLLKIGSRRNWLYSRQLFDSATLVEVMRKELERTVEFISRLKRYA